MKGKLRKLAAIPVLAAGLLLAACGNNVTLDTPKDAGKRISIQPTEGSSSPDYTLPGAATEIKGFETCNSDVIKLLIRSYYAGIVKKDSSAFNGLVSDTSSINDDIFKGYEDVESFNIRELYWMNGENTIGYVVFAVVDVKYKNFEQTIPSLSEFYIKERKDGMVIINGRVSADDYNSTREKINAESKIKSLVNSVNREFRQIIDSDAEIRKYLDEKKLS